MGGGCILGVGKISNIFFFFFWGGGGRVFEIPDIFGDER